jgi:hypothetical protein
MGSEPGADELAKIGFDKLLAVERATVERGKP